MTTVAAQEAHAPVLLEEVLTFLQPRPGGIYCDATTGFGGHARAILERSAPDGRLVALDRDPEAIAAARLSLEPFADRVTLVKSRFSRTREVLEERGAVPLDGVLADLGVSSPQLDRAERGFSFQKSGPLDMRMDPTTGETARDLLQRIEEHELCDVIRDLGEERFARRVARAIIEARDRGELDSTGALAAVVARAVPRTERHKNPATRTFQALRMAVNQELEELDQFLDQAVACLRPGGRMCVIAFHSLEDRLVKRRLRALAGPAPGQPGRPPDSEAASPRLRLLNKKVVVATDRERAANPRSRSAKLRAAERVV
jgi:16S rRNA (cytosine1402-N4)-methyltransferase